jgi:hypothetical protein
MSLSDNQSGDGMIQAPSEVNHESFDQNSLVDFAISSAVVPTRADRTHNLDIPESQTAGAAKPKRSAWSRRSGGVAQSYT